MNREELLSNYIDDMQSERRPGILGKVDDLDDEMLDLLETVRVIKRTYKKKTKILHLPWIRIAATLAAAVFIFVLLVGIEPYVFPRKGSIVHAVVRAYGELNSYQGQVVVKSFENNKVVSEETIEISYQKPWKYHAVHEYNGTKVERISDGSKVAAFYRQRIEVDNLFPEKDLWRYHVGTTVWELEKAQDVQQKGIEKVLGRDAYLIHFRVSEDAEYQKMWVDAETDLPLKKELVFPENRKIVMEFKELRVNPVLEDQVFRIKIPKGEAVKQWNQLSSFENAQHQWDWLSNLNKIIPQELKLVKTGKTNEDTFVLRYKNLQTENDFLDILIMPKPESIRYLGENNKGFVQIKEGVNALGIHIEKTNVGQWVTKDFQGYFVTTRGTGFLEQVLEQLAEKGTEFNF
ncbi:MAG: LolA family protein [Bacillota bacterium]